MYENHRCVVQKMYISFIYGSSGYTWMCIDIYDKLLLESGIRGSEGVY